jgi:hypothetical protein
MKLLLTLVLALVVGSPAFAGTTLDASRYVKDASVTHAKIGANAVDDTQINLTNTGALKSENAAGSGTVNILHVNASNTTVFDQVPQTPSAAAPVNDADVANKKYVDTQVGAIPAAKTPASEQDTLVAGDITAGYKDLAHAYVLGSLRCFNGPMNGVLGTDYSAANTGTGGVTRITFIVTTGWGAGSQQNILAGDILDCSGVY